MTPSLQTTGSFFVVALLICFAPGPDNLFVLVQSASTGFRAGMLVTLGLCTGLLGHTTAVALGLATIFATSSTAFTGLKIADAAYLAWLAWQVWRAPVSAGFGSEQRAASISWRRLYLRGVIMNLTNPKILLFFLAFLPQFVEPMRGRVAVQVIWFGLIFIVATLLAFGTIARLAGFLGATLGKSVKAQRVMNWATAAVFAGLDAAGVCAAVRGGGFLVLGCTPSAGRARMPSNGSAYIPCPVGITGTDADPAA